MSTTLALKSLLGSTQTRLAAAGWVFFVAENAILSENRTALIAHLGDDNYHLLYGSFSTAATASIGYTYYKLKRLPVGRTIISTPNQVTAWAFLSLGLILASQALPKMQIPVTMSAASNGTKMQVRCPFDFSDQKAAVDSHQLRGMERITRHPGLWSFGLIGAGNAALQSHPALKLWWYGPAFVAWLGGSHSDSRFRRGMGGTLDPWYDSQTSNFPFVAMISGKQGRPSDAFAKLTQETKLMNAACAVAAASLFVISRGRLR